MCIYVVKTKKQLKLVIYLKWKSGKIDVVEWKRLNNSLNWKVDRRKQQIKSNSETNLHYEESKN